MDDSPNEGLTSAVCPECGRRTRIVNPRRGDGTGRVFVAHPPTSARRCPGSRTEVRLDP